MNPSNAFPATLLVQLAGGLFFLWAFYRLTVRYARERTFLKRSLWKLVLAGFCILAFWGINSVMFHLEEVKDTEFAQAMTGFNDVRQAVEILGFDHGAGGFAYEINDGLVAFSVRDRASGEEAKCVLKRDKVFIYPNDAVEEAFLLYNSTENTLDLHLPGDAVEIVSEGLSADQIQLEQVESEALRIFLAALNVLEE